LDYPQGTEVERQQAMKTKFEDDIIDTVRQLLQRQLVNSGQEVTISNLLPVNRGMLAVYSNSHHQRVAHIVDGKVANDIVVD
jgi:hypothetical protein